jgi:hypothetical protein
VGTINNTTIGLLSSNSGSFTALTVNNNAIFNGNNQTFNISPGGTGTVNIAPNNISSVDNVNVGLSIPAAGRFTTITVLNQSTQGNQLITLSQLQAILLGAAV